MEFVKVVTIESIDYLTEYFSEMPVWFKGNNSEPINQLTETDLLTLGIYPVDENIPTYDEFFQVIDAKDFSSWTFDQVNNKVLKTYDIVTLSYEEKKSSMIDELAVIRYEHEIEGVAGPGGVIGTDRSSQAMLNSALQVMRDDPNKTIRWKCEDSWVLLDSTSVEQISQLVISHVEDCFDNEFVLWTAIDTATNIDDLRSIDLNSGWSG